MPNFGGKAFLSIHVAIRKVIGEDEFTRKFYFENSILMKAGLNNAFALQDIFGWSYDRISDNIENPENYNK